MIKKVNCITINTDASFCPNTNAGGYAFYIVCDLFRIQHSGKFKDLPKSAEDAEMKCIGNALQALYSIKELPQCKYLILNSDCKTAMTKIDRYSNSVPKTIRRIRTKLVIRLGRCKFEFRHVKAHNGTPDSRSWVNDWCDKNAKTQMREQRQKLLKFC